MRKVSNGGCKTRATIAAAVAALAVVGLSGCTSGDPGPGPGPVPPAPTPPPATTKAPDPVLLPAGTAEQNQPFFDFVNRRTIQVDPSAGGQAITTALRDAGFSMADMQVTADITTVGLKADSLQFSVLWKGKCLMGQYGFGEYRSQVMPVLGTGKCMVGETRPIDW